VGAEFDKEKIMQLRILLLLGIAIVGYGDPITLDVSLNTSPLISHLAGPFSLEFQLDDGSGIGDGNNTAILSNFIFGGGGATGSATPIGGATGSLSSTVSLTDTNFFNQFIQGFTPGSSLQFQLSLTTNVDGGGTPDQFSFAILDSSGTEIPTQAGEFLDFFLSVNIDSSNPTVQTFASDPTRTPVAGGGAITMDAPQIIPVTATPEPSSLSLICLIILLIAVWRKRFVSRTLRLLSTSAAHVVSVALVFVSSRWPMT
jgi:hypothetical protein